MIFFVQELVKKGWNFEAVLFAIKGISVLRLEWLMKVVAHDLSPSQQDFALAKILPVISKK